MRCENDIHVYFKGEGNRMLRTRSISNAGIENIFGIQCEAGEWQINVHLPMLKCLTSPNNFSFDAWKGSQSAQWLRINGVNIFHPRVMGRPKPLSLYAISDLKNEKMNDELWPVLLLNTISTPRFFYAVVFIYSRPFTHSFASRCCENPLWWTIYKSFKSTIHGYSRWFIFLLRVSEKAE